MCQKKKKTNSSNNYANWGNDNRLDTLFESPYSPKEKKSSVVKVMIPVSLIIKVWKRLFK